MKGDQASSLPHLGLSIPAARDKRPLMKTAPHPDSNRRRRAFRFLLFLVVAGLLAFSTKVGTPVKTSPELFHEGEYTGSFWHMKAWQAGKVPFPVLIHGAMDYIPSQIAGAVYGSSRIIGGTRIVNTLIVCATWVLFLELLYLMFPDSMPVARRIAWCLVLFALLAPPFLSMPVQVTESFFGIRDAFLAVLLLGYYHYWNGSIRWKSGLWLALSALLLLPSVFWSYDRGLIAIGFSGLMMLGMAFHKRWTDLAVSAGACLASGILLHQLRWFGPFQGNFSNIFYWIRESKNVWGLPFDFSQVGSQLGLLLILLTCSSGWLLWLFRKANPRGIWFLGGLLLIQILLAKTSLNRPVNTRVLMALYPSVFLLAAIGGRLKYPRREVMPAPSALDQEGPLPDSTAGYPIRSATLAFAGVFGLMALTIGLIQISDSPIVGAYQTFLQTALKPKSDAKMVPAELNDVCSALKNSPGTSLFGWCNEGILQLLARRTWVTRFPYAVYAGSDQDSLLLTELQQADPAVIVSHPDQWSLNIDGRPMASRLPLTSRYIAEHYPESTRIGSYTLHQKASAPTSPAVSPP